MQILAIVSSIAVSIIYGIIFNLPSIGVSITYAFYAVMFIKIIKNPSENNYKILVIGMYLITTAITILGILFGLMNLIAIVMQGLQLACLSIMSRKVTSTTHVSEDLITALTEGTAVVLIFSLSIINILVYIPYITLVLMFNTKYYSKYEDYDYSTITKLTMR